MSTRAIIAAFICLSMGLCFGTRSAWAQQAMGPSPDPEFPFRPEKNRLLNASSAMGRFWHRLRQLEAGDLQRVTVLHIGDSHIQADWFSGEFRHRLQRRFGSAGRGMVFPYAVAHTNSPQDIRSSSSVDWQARRNVSSEPPLPIGVAGITIETTAYPFLLRIAIEGPQQGVDDSFDRILLFCNKGAELCDLAASEKISPDAPPAQTVPARYHRVRSGENLGGIARKYGLSLSQLRKLNGITGSLIYPGQRLLLQRAGAGSQIIYRPADYRDLDTALLSTPGLEPFVSLLELPATTQDIYLRSLEGPAQPEALRIFGMSLERRGARGILYHSIGVNGAKFEDYNRSEYFWAQIASLHPDLVIVSLGTNESLEESFVPQDFRVEMETFLEALRTAAPAANILMTTPPDGMLRGREPNPFIAGINVEIGRQSRESGTALWDFYEVMGGGGSMGRWYAQGLAQRDRLHFNKQGYELMGGLLFNAMIQAYEGASVPHRP